ncbi:MAG: hypothetical protein IPK68_22340 [Bdellovibrionales bacterium]|nr:hypothetical protein [Bdellovibrionales bacterium]
MKRFLFVLAAALFTGPMAFGEKYERDGNFILRVTPYKELWATQDGIKLTAQVAQQVLVGVMESLKKNI